MAGSLGYGKGTSDSIKSMEFVLERIVSRKILTVAYTQVN
jgi:hypothetical protein